MHIFPYTSWHFLASSGNKLTAMSCYWRFFSNRLVRWCHSCEMKWNENWFIQHIPSERGNIKFIPYVFNIPFHFALHQAPGVLRFNRICKFIQGLIKLLLENALKFCMLYISGNSNRNFNNEDDCKENRKCANHPWGFTQSATTTEEADDENQCADNHQNNWRCPKVFSNKILIVLVAALNDCSNDDGEKTSQLIRII